MRYTAAIAEACRKRGIHFVLFIVPTGILMSEERWEERFERPYDRDWSSPAPIADIVRYLRADGNDVDILNPLDKFRSRSESEVLYLGKDRDGHWTEAGCEAAAGAMFRHLVSAPVVREHVRPGLEARRPPPRPE